MLDFNDAGPQLPPMGELIPDGTFCQLQMTIRPGKEADGPTPQDRGLLKRAKSGDVLMLDCEFTVKSGPYANRKFWQMFTVAGGKTDSKGQSMGWSMTKRQIRAMIESARGVKPDDESPEANAKRQMESLSALNGIVFAGKVMIEPASSDDYNDQNRLAHIVVPGEEKYDAVRAGNEVEPEPVNAKPRKSKTDNRANTGWQGQGGGSTQAGSQGQLGGNNWGSGQSQGGGDAGGMPNWV